MVGFPKILDVKSEHVLRNRCKDISYGKTFSENVEIKAHVPVDVIKIGRGWVC